MSKTQWIFLGVFFFLTTSFSPQKYSDAFANLLKRSGLIFEMPVGMLETKIFENRQMNYEYALQYPNQRFEVRYAIRPLDSLVLNYKEQKKRNKPGEIRINPNKFYTSLLQATTMNISGGQLPEVVVFDSTAVKQEFNADWGGTTFVSVGKEFGQDYKFCMIVAIHKDDLGDAYFFYLSDNQNDFEEYATPAFHSLKFK